VSELRVTIGTRVRVRGALHGENGEPISGVTVTAEAKPPTGDLRTVTATEADGIAGTYDAEFDGDVAGRFHVRFECADPLTTAETTFVVEPSAVE
jgi:hypothetical protein